MKILVIGDRYGLPRYDRTGYEVEMPVEDTYPEQLRMLLQYALKEDVMLINHCRNINTTEYLNRDALVDLELISPEVVIVQLGMADLWPAHLHRARPLYDSQRGKDPWVSRLEFYNNLRIFANRMLDFADLGIFVNIPAVNYKGRERNLVANRILEYNAVFNKLKRCPDDKNIAVVDLYNLIEEFGKDRAIGTDTIHPTRDGARQLVTVLATIILTRIR